ncbi:MAG: sigma-70 domain-containing protein [Candidatus Bipolaricaulia bacterium]
MREIEISVTGAGEPIQRPIQKLRESRDPGLERAMVIAHRDLIESIARDWVIPQRPVDDLIPRGYIGLLNAIYHAHPISGNGFRSHAAHLITREIVNHLHDENPLAGMPAWVQRLDHQVSQIIGKLYQESGRLPTIEEITKALNIEAQGILEILKTRMDPTAVNVSKIRNKELETFKLPIQDKIRIARLTERFRRVYRNANRLTAQRKELKQSLTETVEAIGILTELVDLSEQDGLSKDSKKVRRIHLQLLQTLVDVRESIPEDLYQHTKDRVSQTFNGSGIR